jgi:hypothetical protein
MDDVRAQTLSRPGDGYVAALGYLQIGSGVLSLTMSLMALVQALFSHSELFHPTTALGLSSELLDNAITAYVLLQLSLGWVAGGLQLAAGYCCLHSRRARLVWVASLISLANFPHGTMSAILMLLGLRRPEVIEAFRSRDAA